MKIPETYEEYLKTPKSDLKKLIESDNLSIEDMMTLYTFNKQAIEEEKNLPISECSSVQRNTLWEELRGELKWKNFWQYIIKSFLSQSLKSKKWFYTGTSKGIAIFENVEHLSDRLKLRYEIEYKEWGKNGL